MLQAGRGPVWIVTLIEFDIFDKTYELYTSKVSNKLSSLLNTFESTFTFLFHYISRFSEPHPTNVRTPVFKFKVFELFQVLKDLSFLEMPKV